MNQSEVWRVPLATYSPLLRVLNRALNLLPRPAGEEILAALGVAHGLLSPARRRRALDWVARQPTASKGRSGLVLSLFAHHGRFIAQDALVGIRHPDRFRRDLVVEGAEHLTAASARGGTILLGFHLGPPGTWLALRVMGHHAIFVGRPEASGRWPRAPWRGLTNPDETVSISGPDPEVRVGGLYEARRLLLDGRTVFITADGPFGREAFRISLPGGPAVLRSGWLALRWHSGATTVPVLAHTEHRRRIVTIHPPLPAVSRDPSADLAACREILTPLLEAYVRRFPEQCRYLAFWS